MVSGPACESGEREEKKSSCAVELSPLEKGFGHGMHPRN